MADLKVYLVNNAPEVNLMANDLEQDGGLFTSIVQSIFTDLAEDGGPGSWVDTIENTDRYVGSRLYTIKKNDDSSIVKAIGYLEDCLQWLIDDAIAESISVSAERVGAQRTNFKIVLKRASGEDINFLYVRNWENEQSFVEGLE